MDGPKLRPDISPSVGIGGMRDVFIIEACLFVVFRGSNAWHVSSFCAAFFEEMFSDSGFVVWLLESSG